MQRLATALLLAGVLAGSAEALPTMIRLGYSDCAACHFSPQGGGPLNAYGRGIDEAQSRRAGEYRPKERGILAALDWGGRMTQDLRVVAQDQRLWASHAPTSHVFRPRLMYRNVTQLSEAWRVSATVTGEGESAPRPDRRYDPAQPASTIFVSTALVHYRVGERLEIAAGRDQLPSGVNLPDLTLYIKSRNRLGYYDAPAQIKAYWGGKQLRVSPFVYGPGGGELPGDAESGAGALAEMNLAGKSHIVVGASVLRGAATNGDRRTLGGYARLGFGSWGILAEHDVTRRTRADQGPGAVGQTATYLQAFWAAREWLTASAIGERLSVTTPFREQLVAGRLELNARLTPGMSFGVGTRVQRDRLTGRTVGALTMQAAFKTVR